METGKFLFQVNLIDDWTETTETWYCIFDYTNIGMTHWSKSIDWVLSSTFCTMDSLPSKAELALKYGSEFGFFLPLTEPFDIHAQYPELFI